MLQERIWGRIRRLSASLWRYEVHELAFTSLGLAVLDELQFGSGQIIQNVIGGSGTYGRQTHLPLESLVFD
jgi:hypothetical protein